MILNILIKLHKLHNDFLLAPEKLEISDNVLPNYCNNIGIEHRIETGVVNKLVPNLGNKSKYVLQLMNNSTFGKTMEI